MRSADSSANKHRCNAQHISKIELNRLCIKNCRCDIPLFSIKPLSHSSLFMKLPRLLLVLLLLLGSHLFCTEDSAKKTVLIAILAKDKAHILPHYLQCIERLDYDKKLITIYINTNNNSDNTKEVLQNWMESRKSQYKAIHFENREYESLPNTRPHEWINERFKVLGAIRNKSMKKAKECDCDYYFVVDCDNFITPQTLSTLIKEDKPIIAPMLKPIPEEGDFYSNFFCDVNEYGYYKPHPDYYDIFLRKKIGTFKAPVVHCTYLIKSEYIDKLTYVDGSDDYEFVIFSKSARENNVDQYICNKEDFGTLIHLKDDFTLEDEIKELQAKYPSILQAAK